MNEQLMRFTKIEIIEIMSDALDLMNQFNGRSVDFCVDAAIKNAKEEMRASENHRQD